MAAIVQNNFIVPGIHAEIVQEKLTEASRQVIRSIAEMLLPEMQQEGDKQPKQILNLKKFFRFLVEKYSFRIQAAQAVTRLDERVKKVFDQIVNKANSAVGEYFALNSLLPYMNKVTEDNMQLWMIQSYALEPALKLAKEFYPTKVQDSKASNDNKKS